MIQILTTTRISINFDVNSPFVRLHKKLSSDFPDFNSSTDNIWPENNQKTSPKDSTFGELSAEADNEKPVHKKEEINTHKISVGKQSVFSRALEDTRADADRLDASVGVTNGRIFSKII